MPSPVDGDPLRRGIVRLFVGQVRLEHTTAGFAGPWVVCLSVVFVDVTGGSVHLVDL